MQRQTSGYHLNLYKYLYNYYMVYNKFNEYLKIDILLSINTLSVTLRTLQGVIGKLVKDHSCMAVAYLYTSS